MSHITGEIVHELWLKTPKSEWGAFYYTLKRYGENDDGIEMEEELQGELLKLTDEIILKEEPFPESERELYELLNNWAH